MGNGTGTRVAALVAMCCLALAACPGVVDPADEPAIAALDTGRVYTAGHSTGSMRAYYWVDDELRAIPDVAGAVATRAACVVPTNLGDYVVGARTDFVDPALIQRAVVWFGGIGAFLDDAPSFAFGAALHEGAIHVAGWRNPDGAGDRPCVWEVRDTWTLSGGAYAVASRSIVRHDLDADGGFGQARDIVSDGANLYVCGHYGENPNTYACYWRNGERAALAGGTWAEAICVHGDMVCVGGKSATAARYWIDGVGQNLSGFPAGSSDWIVSAVAPGDGGPFLGGTYYKDDYRGFSWFAGALTTSLSPVIGVGVRGTDLYLGCEDGWYMNAKFVALPWIEGTIRPRGLKARLY